MVAPENILQNPWTLWFETRPEENGASSLIYQDRLAEICSMVSVEQFHQYYSYMKKPDSLPVHSTVYVFRDRVRPMWESFPEGGCWTFAIPRGSDRLNGAWERLVFSCIGEGLGSNNVAGIVVGSRVREFVLSVWLVSGQSSGDRFEVMNHLRELWQLKEGDIIQYKDFHSAVQDDSARLNAVSYRVRAPGNTKGHVERKKKFILPDPVCGSFAFKY